MQTNNRLLYIDNLRSLMIILVVFLHSAVTYSGIGSWYYVENMSAGKGATLFFVFFESFTQAYFMSLLFLLAGYFVPGAISKKGNKQFVKDRLFRLGIPVCIYIIFIHPVCVKLAYPGINFFDFYITGFQSLELFSWTGPLWFALTLLIFSLGYAFIRPFVTLKSNIKITSMSVIFLILVITILAFAIRLIYPIGSSVMNLQFCFFAAYIVLFIVGAEMYKQNILSLISIKIFKYYLFVSLVIGIPLWFAISIFSGVSTDISIISGGFHWEPLAYAFWESFFCVTFIIALIGLFKNIFHTQNKIQKFISDNSFGVYFFHAPVLIAVTILCKSLELPSVLKFLISGSIAVSFTFILVFLIRKIPFMKYIFS